MDKYALAAHLANLTFVFDFHEKLGTMKNPALVREFSRAHEALVDKLVEEEKDNEARRSKS